MIAYWMLGWSIKIHIMYIKQLALHQKKMILQLHSMAIKALKHIDSTFDAFHLCDIFLKYFYFFKLDIFGSDESPRFNHSSWNPRV